MGSVTPVKCLGALAMIDDGELDWKMICISTADPLAAKLNDVEDVEREMPGELKKILEWFRDYKIPDGEKRERNESKTQGAERERGNGELERCALRVFSLLLSPSPPLFFLRQARQPVRVQQQDPERRVRGRNHRGDERVLESLEVWRARERRRVRAVNEMDGEIEHFSEVF